MFEFEEIRKKHRRRIIQNIFDLAYDRSPTIEDFEKIELLLDDGKSISEILSSLQFVNKKRLGSVSLVDSAQLMTIFRLDKDSQVSSMSTPLEIHIREYLIK